MRERLAVLGLVAVMALELGMALRGDGLTVDEIVYIGSGYRHLTALDYRLNPEQPPLAKLLGALPLLGLGLRVPQVLPGEGEWGWSYRFVHVENDAGPIVRWARVPNALLTVSLALLLWGWARAVAGTAAGLLALGLTAFHPSLLAHGHLLTTDLPGALTMAAASWAFWRWSLRPDGRRAVLVGAAVGFAVATRLTGWLLVPSFLVLTVHRWRRTPPAERKALARSLGVLVLAGLVLVPGVIWAAYGFRHAPWPGESVARAPGPWLGTTGRVIAALQSWRVLPEPYLEGARFVAEHNVVGHPTYLLGEISTTGWPHYYLVAFLVKNTPGFLLAVAGAALVVWRRRDIPREVLVDWLVPATLMFLAASLGRIQIGERYILPVYPYLILLAATAGSRLVEAPRGGLAVAVVLALHALPSLLAAPRGYLTYFNVSPCRADGSRCILLDSNLDWGQDLPRLAAWMKRNGAERVQLGYHGSDDPDRHRIRHEDLPGLHLYPPRPPERPFAGTVAVSPSLRLGVFTSQGGNPYAALAGRAPDDRAGVFFIYRFEASAGLPGPR